MTREPAFLIAAVRRFLNPVEDMPDAQTIDWPTLLRLAGAHSVTPMLFMALEEVSIPAAAAEELRAAFERSVVRSMAQVAELTRITGLLQNHGIPVVWLKGPLLSQ